MTRPVDVEIFGHNGADLAFLADCLEGRKGEARRHESTAAAAKFIRAALAQWKDGTPLVLPVVSEPPPGA